VPLTQKKVTESLIDSKAIKTVVVALETRTRQSVIR